MFYGSGIYNFIGAIIHYLVYNLYAFVLGKKILNFKTIREGNTKDFGLNMGYQSFHNVLGTVTLVIILLAVQHFVI